MRKLILPAIFIAASACAVEDNSNQPGANTAAQSAQDIWRINPTGDLNQFFDCLQTDGLTIVSAHRGGPQPGYPENAIETMSAILKDAPAIMEIDVATSSDGVLYLMHDDTLDRTTSGSGQANGLPWSRLQSLNLEDNDGRSTPYQPSRFDDALKWANGRTVLQIDFKKTTRYEDVTREIRNQNAEDRVILIAYSMASARKLHNLAPRAMISLSVNSQSELNRAVAAGIPADKLLGFTGTQSPRPRLFSTLNARDVEVIFGTLGGRNSLDRDIERSGDSELYAQIAANGVDIIATDRPIAAHRALASANKGARSGACGITGPTN